MDWGINELSSAFNLRSNEMTYTRAQQIISEYLNRGYNPTTKKYSKYIMTIDIMKILNSILNNLWMYILRK